MAIVTLGQAAKLTQLSKTTLVRQIKSGKLSAIRNEDGSYSIDTSELARVHKVTPVTGADTDTVASNETPEVTPSDDLKVRLAVADEKIKSLQEMLDEVRKSRDDAVQMAKQSQQLLLSYQGQRGILKRLFGG